MKSSRVAMVCLFAGTMAAGAFTVHALLASDEPERAASLAQRYVVDMYSGRCPAAQRLATMAGSAEYCQREGMALTNVRVSCTHDKQRHDEHFVSCRLASSTLSDVVFVRLVARDGRVLVIDAVLQSTLEDHLGVPRL